MAILIDKNTRYLIQGMTGKEGTRALNWMRALGSVVVAGVTPGKGGQEVQGVPVYNSVAEAVKNHPEINATCIYAPPKFVRSAVKEAIAAGVALIHIIAENIPTRDTAEMLELAKQKSQEQGKQVFLDDCCVFGLSAGAPLPLRAIALYIGFFGKHPPSVHTRCAACIQRAFYSSKFFTVITM